MVATRASARGIGWILLAIGVTGLASCAHSSVRPVRPLDLEESRQFLLDRAASDDSALLALSRLEGGLAEWHTERGLASLAVGDLRAARHALEQALTIDPRHPDARRGYASLRARLAQRDAAEEVLAAAIREGDWRLAFDAATVIPPADLARYGRVFDLERSAHTVIVELRRRLFLRLGEEIRVAEERGDVERVRARIAEAKRALDLGPAADPGIEALRASLAEWRTTLAHRRVALGHRQAAWAELLAGDEIHSWRLYRLARLHCPDDRELAAEEESLRGGVRRTALEALLSSSLDCDLEAARVGLELFDELAEGWPGDAPATRAEVVSWITEDLRRRARDAEERGKIGQALIHWLAILEVSGDPAASRSIDRLASLVRETPRLAVRRLHEPPVAPGTGILEVVLAPPRVEESVDRVHSTETIGTVRSGVRVHPDAWRSSDARRWQETLLEILTIREEWLSARPTRAALGLRRFRFQLVELHRLGERLQLLAPTSERGVWRENEMEVVHERRLIRIVQPLLLLRDGRAIGELTITATDVLAGQLPEGSLPGTIDRLPAGEALRERLRLRLEAECRRRTPITLDTLRRVEIERRAVQARELWRGGAEEEAIEGMVAAWLQSDAEDDPLCEQSVVTLSEWTGIPLGALTSLR